MYVNQSLANQTLTNAGTLTFNPNHDVQDNFDGVVSFDVLATNVSGTTAGDCQLQGSIDGTNWVNIGSTVAIANGVTKNVPMGGVILYFAKYRITVAGAGTQVSTIAVKYCMKGGK
jgi:hypothetical protein